MSELLNILSKEYEETNSQFYQAIEEQNYEKMKLINEKLKLIKKQLVKESKKETTSIEKKSMR